MAPPAIGTDPWRSPHPTQSSLDSAKFMGVSSIQTDHDYVLNSGPLDNGQTSMSPVFKGDVLSLYDDDDVDDEMIYVDVPDNGVVEKGVDVGVVDAMLSAAPMHGYNSSAEADDMDFLQELDDMHFDLNDLDPCNDFSMDQSFEDFLDDKHFCPYTIDDFFPDDPSSTQESGQGEVMKETFMRQLGLVPASRHISDSDLDSLHNGCAVSDFLSFSKTNSTQVASSEMILDSEEPHLSSKSSPLPSLQDGVFHWVPTKTCSNSEAADSVRSLYSTAKASPTQHVRICASTVHTHVTNSSFRSMASYSGQTWQLSDSLPSNMSGSGDDAVPLSGPPADSGDFLQWLMGEEVSSEESKSRHVVSDVTASGHSSAETPSASGSTRTFTDHERYMDLEDYVKDSEQGITEEEEEEEEEEGEEGEEAGLVQTEGKTRVLPSNDHTYHQLTIQVPKSKMDKTHQLQLSILSHSKTREETSLPGGQHVSEISVSDLRTSTTSPSMFGQMDEVPLSPYNLKMGGYSSNQLDLLAMFSDEAASSLLFSDSIVSDLRLM